MKQPELKFCPFCGGEAVIDGAHFYWVRCTSCKAETRGVHNRVVAADLWNRRAGDLRERVVQDDRR
jgi:Lar family restriction alleviation protein